MLFYREQIYNSVRFKSFYKPEKVSEALAYIWKCPPKEKWSRIAARMRTQDRYSNRKEEDLRSELSQIGNRRDLIAHSMDTPPGADHANPVSREDAVRVIEFITDLAESIEQETETQLSAVRVEA